MSMDIWSQFWRLIALSCLQHSDMNKRRNQNLNSFTKYGSIMLIQVVPVMFFVDEHSLSSYQSYMRTESIRTVLSSAIYYYLLKVKCHPSRDEVPLCEKSSELAPLK